MRESFTSYSNSDLTSSFPSSSSSSSSSSSISSSSRVVSAPFINPGFFSGTSPTLHSPHQSGARANSEFISSPQDQLSPSTSLSFSSLLSQHTSRIPVFPAPSLSYMGIGVGEDQSKQQCNSSEASTVVSLPIPISLPLPLLTSLHSELSGSNRLAEKNVELISSSLYKKLLKLGLRTLSDAFVEILDFFLPQAVKQNNLKDVTLKQHNSNIQEHQQHLSQEQPSSQSSSSTSPLSDFLDSGTTVSGASFTQQTPPSIAVPPYDVSSPKSTDFSFSSASSCDMCSLCGYHVCRTRWYALITLFLLISLLSLILIPLALVFSFPPPSAPLLYSSSFFLSFSTLFYIRSLPSHLMSSFLTHSAYLFPAYLYILFSYQAIGSGFHHPFSTLSVPLLVVSVAMFLGGAPLGGLFYCLSMLTIGCIYWSASAVPTEYLLFTPLFLTIITFLLLGQEKYNRHHLSLLSAAVSHHQHGRKTAESANAAKSQFLATTSHDLRTPLNSILPMLQLTLGDKSLNEEQRECLTTALTSGELMLELLTDLLDLSRIEAGQLRFESIPFELSSLYEKAIKTFASQAQKKGIELIYEIDPQLLKPINNQVKGDPSRHLQIINNLLSNSCKFTHSGQIILRSSLLPSLTPGYIHIHTVVIDSGEGMTSEGLKRIFRPFSQADQSISRRHGGSGLGLTISAELVKLSGGKIWCASQKGVGSEFHITSQFVAQHEGIQHDNVTTRARLRENTGESEVDQEKKLELSTSEEKSHPASLISSAGGSTSSMNNSTRNAHTVVVGTSSSSQSASAPLPSRRLDGTEKLTFPASSSSLATDVPLRCLLAINNKFLAEVIARLIVNWSNQEFRTCEIRKVGSKLPASSVVTTQLDQDNIPSPLSPSLYCSLSNTISPPPSHHHITHIHILPPDKLTTEGILSELEWGLTTRQGHDLIVLDESLSNSDTVKVLAFISKLPTSHSIGSIVLTTRLLSAVMRCDGVSSYVLVSKPVLPNDMNRALGLVLSQTPNLLRSTPTLTRRLQKRDLTSSSPHPLHHLSRRYIGSSRKPKEEKGRERSRERKYGRNSPTIDTNLSQLNIKQYIQSLSNKDQSMQILDSLNNPSISMSEVGQGKDERLIAHSTTSQPGTQQILDTNDESSSTLTKEVNKSITPNHTDFFIPFSAPGLLEPSCSVSSLVSDQDALNRSQSLPEFYTSTNSNISYETDTPHLSLYDPRQRSLSFSYSSINIPSPYQFMKQQQESFAEERRRQVEESMEKGDTESTTDKLEPLNLDLNSFLSNRSSSEGWIDREISNPIRPAETPRLPSLQTRKFLPSATKTDELEGRESRLGNASPSLTSIRLRSAGSSPSYASSTPSSPVSQMTTPAQSSPSSSSAHISGMADSSLSSSFDNDHSLKLVCVDDNKINLKVAGKILNRLGYSNYTLLSSGEEAIKVAADLHSSGIVECVILMDLVMPGIDGCEATRAIRAAELSSGDSQHSAFHIIALTAAASDESQGQCLAAGMNDFVSKPLNVGYLEAAINRYLTKRKKEMSNSSNSSTVTTSTISVTTRSPLH